MEVELRKPYKISELIEIATKDYWGPLPIFGRGKEGRFILF